MVDISLRPIRLNRISFLPASVSKYHELPLLTRGRGVGQFLAPMYKTIVPSGSFTKRCISCYLCTKLARLLASSVSSPDETICFPSGPRISSITFSSLLCTAVTNALLASSGDENVFCPRCCPTERTGKPPANKMPTVAISRRLVQSNLSKFSFLLRMWLLSISKFHDVPGISQNFDYQCLPPPPPRAPPPPPKLALPRDEKLLSCPPWS